MEESKLLSLGASINSVVGAIALKTSDMAPAQLLNKKTLEKVWAMVTKNDTLFETLAKTTKQIADMDAFFQTLGGAILIAFGGLLLLEALLSHFGVKGWELSGATAVNVVAAGVLVSRLPKDWPIHPVIFVIALSAAVIVIGIRLFALIIFFTGAQSKPRVADSTNL